MHAFDRQMDGQTEFSSLDPVCIPYSAVKNSCTQSENCKKKYCGAAVRPHCFLHTDARARGGRLFNQEWYTVRQEVDSIS